MTAAESLAILAILKAAYPNSYKNVTADDAASISAIWAAQFAEIPAKIVLIAVNKWIASNPFPPAISELKRKIEGLYYEAWETLQSDRISKKLSPEQKAELKQIQDVTARLRSRATLEPPLLDLTAQAGNLLPGV
jgi:hypothetical protein